MKIELKEISIRSLVESYEDKYEEGVVGYSGLLNIRPKYQREFIYDNNQQVSVINTIIKKFPLNVMYWVVNNELNKNFEVLDGQQRAISICEYYEGNFQVLIDNKKYYFENLTKDEQEQILDYKLMVYFCEGTEREKLDWFKTINIAGEKLTAQELRNAVYTGTWLSDAKIHFSKTKCEAYNIGSKYIKGVPIRQEYLETVIKWISNNKIEDYMSKKQNKSNANELWTYYQRVIGWIEIIFPNYRKEMKGIDWGVLYNEYKDKDFDSEEIEIEITKLMQDEDVTKKAGIYSFIITGNEKYLNIRSFTANQKREAYERQEGICLDCSDHFELNEMEADHITPWSKGGKTISDNCQMLCQGCNRTKSDK